MHTEIDQLTKWQTLSKITGHSVRYLRIRAAVRVTLAWAPIAGLIALYGHALAK